MGLDLLSVLKNKLPKNAGLAFGSTFVFALLIHLYQFANGFPGRDSFLNAYADQNILGSGRWALSVACSISSYYDLPWVIGLISCFFIALTGMLMVMLLRIDNPVLVLITGGLLASAPTVTETVIFLYTADGYFIAMFLAALGAYLSRIGEGRWQCWLLSAVCICISCGIYQAYLSLYLILAVCSFMQELLENRLPKKELLWWVVRQAVICIAALASYYLIWKLCMKVQNVVPNEYQGIADVGTVSWELLKNGLFSAIRTFKWYFAPWSVATYGFTPYITLNFLFVLFFGAGLVLAVVKSGILRRLWAVALLGLCLIAIIPFSCIWHFTSDSVYYRAMMLPGMTVLFVFAAVLYEQYGRQWVKNLFGLLLTAVIMNNLVMANIVYLHMNRSYERSFAEASAMVSQIRQLQKEYGVDRYMVAGQRYAKVQLKGNDPEYATTNERGQIQLFLSVLDENLLIEEQRVGAFLRDTFSVELEQISCLQSEIPDSEAFREMPSWPEGGSVAVMDDILVIKLSDEK